MDGAETLLGNITKVIINPIITLLFAVALLVFVWGIVEYILKASKGGDDLKAAKNHLIYGVFGMFLMAAVFGILELIKNIVGA